MDKETAKKAVDIALSSENKTISFEFQGGEPLLNYEIIKYIVEYSQENAQDKKISFNIVSNLTLLTDEMIEFFKKYNVNICTSVDGNENIQNKNRPYKKGNSYKETVKKIEMLRLNGLSVSAIETTTKYSLDKYKEIIDEYVKLNFKEIFIRPLTNLGKASNNWDLIGYTPEEFIEFYRKCLNYILQLNKEGKSNIIERQAVLFLKKIVENNPQNYMELRSPCGGAIGQLAYYFNGDIYTCDEARMLSEMGNDSFKLGNVYTNTFEDLMKSKTTEALCVSSCLECLKSCHSCVYMPYCGVCPVVNLAQEHNIFSNKAQNYRCKINKGIMNILFEIIEKNNEDFEIMKKWLCEID